ncbi:hypothetical protein CR66_05050 [Campylobacter mucosalis]|uniref:hypothetical protein n=1 Tax=Campylobacter mucosalis TaxID=202 RepID=UPI0004D8AB52|nr:hypothetical protein [Campylobacter mucosalis]KEA45783.1 hypothetical protein CR66_05050 [Campylobacter mucosalis]QKF62301.1 hypothetical protein CMCT_0132 [Campylobacter mucosalis]
MRWFLPVLVLFFIGCSTRSVDGLSYEYYENNSSKSEILFTNSTDINATNAVYIGKDSDQKILGNSYTKNKDSSILVLNLDTNQSVNLHDKSDLNGLYKAKSIKIYDFNKNKILKTAVYSSDNKVCNSSEIFINSVINYYDIFADITKPFGVYLALKFDEYDGISVITYNFLTDDFTDSQKAMLIKISKTKEFMQTLSYDINEQVKTILWLCPATRK